MRIKYLFYYLSLLLGLCFSTNSYAQDSVLVRQKDAALFSNKYIFYPDNSFKHYFLTDDGQVLYGRGRYKDKGRFRILAFKDIDTSIDYRFHLVHYEANFTRKLKIKGKHFISRDYYHTTTKKRVVFKP